MAEEKILSVGIDIGTSTSQVIFSKITLEDNSGYFSVPNVAISQREVVYESGAHLTPLLNNYLIDAEKVKKIVASEFKKAGVKPKDTDTGAVIITGESAKKENAEIISKALSEFAGDFVISSAGADLESIIAGKGSGAAEISAREEISVLNLDIGGGTTNIALFDCGKVVSEGCLDIGGRLIKTDENGRITYIAKSVEETAQKLGIKISVGDIAEEKTISAVTDEMCKVLSDYVSGKEDRLLKKIKTFASKDFSVGKTDAVVFSGGVADFIYKASESSFTFGDIGEILARSVRGSDIYKNNKILSAQRTLSATVVGAGTHTLSVSGSTIDYTGDIFPLKNVPILKLSSSEEKRLREGKQISEKLRWFSEQSASEKIAVAICGESDPSYSSITNSAEALVNSFGAVLPSEEPIIIIIENDNAAALGQAVERLKTGRNIICIDGISVNENDFIDIGKPLLGGTAVPVVLKTLIFA